MRVPTLTTVVVAACLLLQAPTAAAYIDPGTGSALFYVVSGIVVSLYFSVRSLYYRILEWVFRARYKGQRCDLAIHCEDPRYETTFLPIVAALRQRGIDTTLFTMYERGQSFEPLPAGVRHTAIAPGMVGYAYLNHLEAKVLVTTTPQLDVMTFRRSRRVRHYAFVQHALGESRYVRPFAYDYFDSVLCCGDTLKANIRKIEAIRGLSAKRLYDTGVPHYEELIRRSRDAHPPKGDTVVLIAPSWGPHSLFQTVGADFVERIASAYRVIVRPHPQMKISEPQLYAKLLSLKGVAVDTERTPANAMSQAHVLVSDISGIMHEFAFIHERPVVIIDRKQEAGGLEGELVGGDSELKERCREFIVPVPVSEASGIVEQIGRALANHSVERLRQVRSETVYNFDRASLVAAAQLAEILEREKAVQQPAKKWGWRQMFLSRSVGAS